MDEPVTPRLVLVHGTRMSSTQWGPYRALLPGVEVVAPDLPGHGDRVGEEFTVDAAVATVAAAVEGAARGGPVVLVGHSLGGYMASIYASGHPGTLAGLVLVGASADPGGPLTGLYRGFARLLPLVGHARMARVVNAVMRALGARGEHAAALPDGAAYAALPAAWQAVIDGCGPHLLRRVGCPVVLVNGQWDQMRLHVRRYAAACDQVRVVTVPRATHLLPATHPEALAAVLLDVVAQARG
jgi:pimeloyl-ACP methyl ester carboxylesterase